LLAILVACNPPAAAGSATSSGAVGDRDAAATDAGSAVGASKPIELFSWWARVGESGALEALSEEHRRHYPNDTIINATTELSGLARSTLVKRMERNEPPDTFQGNVGRDLMQWVLVNGLDANESKLLPLDGVIADVAVWRQTMPKAILDEVTYDGKLYAVPSNIHRLNSIFYNENVFRAYGLTEPKTLDDLRTMARKLQGGGVKLLAIGAREPWTLALIAFECLLVAREGPGFYESYFRGHLKPDDPRIVADLRALLDLLTMANDDYAQLTWLQAVDLVARGKAAMTIMGDWARGSFTERGLRIGKDYQEIPFPQSDGAFVYTSDAFPLPLQAKNRAGAERLLATIGSVEGQRAVNSAKDALSARADVPPVDDPTLARKYALFKKGPLALALSGLVPARFADDVAAALVEMAEQHDLEPALQTLRTRYALLK
jgi:glucose/mannose transport system substrate-binding protein